MTVERSLVVSDDASIGERLRLARVAARKSPVEVARAIGVSLRTYQRMEEGSRRARSPELLVIAQITGQELAFFGASLDSSEPPNLSPLADAVKPEPKAAA